MQIDDGWCADTKRDRTSKTYFWFMLNQSALLFVSPLVLQQRSVSGTPPSQIHWRMWHLILGDCATASENVAVLWLLWRMRSVLGHQPFRTSSRTFPYNEPARSSWMTQTLSRGKASGCSRVEDSFVRTSPARTILYARAAQFNVFTTIICTVTLDLVLDRPWWLTGLDEDNGFLKKSPQSVVKGLFSQWINFRPEWIWDK